MSENYFIEIIVDGNPAHFETKPESVKPEPSTTSEAPEFKGILENARIKDIGDIPPNEVYVDNNRITEYALWVLSREVFFMDQIQAGQWVLFRWTFDGGRTFYDYGTHITIPTRYVKWGRPKKTGE